MSEVKNNSVQSKGTVSKTAELEAKIASLEALLAKAESAISTLTSQATSNPQPVYNVPTNTDVTLVYASVSPGYIFVEGAGLSLHCTRYGESFVLSRSQLDAVIGKYRHWFDQGILAVADKDYKVAAEKGVRTFGELSLSAQQLDKLGSMSSEDIEKLWNSVDHAQKQGIVGYYKRKFIENAPGYRNRERVDTLNRLTGDGFTREIDELRNDYKYRPIEIL